MTAVAPTTAQVSSVPLISPAQSDQDKPEAAAAATALYDPRPDHTTEMLGHEDKQGRNGSSVAAKTRQSSAHYLRRADAQDLPSYPVAGLSHPEAAGAAAALLAHSSAKPVEIWKPNPTSAAGAAASLAHTNKRSTDMWKAAADHPGAGKAALHAFGGKAPASHSGPAIVDSTKQWPLTGALGAFHGSGGRRRSGSSPVPLASRDRHSSNESALESAFLVPDLPGERSVASPPLGARGNGERSLEEKRKSDILRAATISMRKNKEEPQTVTPAVLRVPLSAAERVLNPETSTTTSTSTRQPKYPHLEEAARKIAQERLARIGYTTETIASQSPAQGCRSLSLSNTSNGRYQVDADMSKLKKDIAEADKRKRGQDAVLLMAAAKRNVQARMSGIDSKVAESKGLVNRDDWHAKATELAQKDSDSRLQHHGKVDIGGGAYMSQKDIDAIAQRNVRPIIDEMDRQVSEDGKKEEIQKAREEEARLDKEHAIEAHRFLREQEKKTEKEVRNAKVIEKHRRKQSKFSGNVHGADVVEKRPNTEKEKGVLGKLLGGRTHSGLGEESGTNTSPRTGNGCTDDETPSSGDEPNTGTPAGAPTYRRSSQVATFGFLSRLRRSGSNHRSRKFTFENKPDTSEAEGRPNANYGPDTAECSGQISPDLVVEDDTSSLQEVAAAGSTIISSGCKAEPDGADSTDDETPNSRTRTLSTDSACVVTGKGAKEKKRSILKILSGRPLERRRTGSSSSVSKSEVSPVSPVSADSTLSHVTAPESPVCITGRLVSSGCSPVVLNRIASDGPVESSSGFSHTINSGLSAFGARKAGAGKMEDDRGSEGRGRSMESRFHEELA